MMHSRHYKAFISYSHGDEAWARWLQRSLEKYKLPKTFRQTHPELPARLYPIFRDRDELASGGDLSESIRAAMDDSDALIVICSPAARASMWVNEEIKRFKASGRGERIFCFLVSGNPNANSPECAFPSAILQDENGYVVHEPLAADATPKGDGKRNAMLKIAAGLLNVGVDDLKQRDAQRQARFWLSIAIGSLFIAALTIGLAIYALNAKRESEIARKESELRRSQAEGLIGFMLGDLRKKLEPIGRLDILDAVGEQAMSYFTSLGNRGTQKELLSRAVALKQIGDVRFNQGKLEPALKSFQQALTQSEALYKSDPNNNDYLFELGQAEFWVGYVAWERGDLEQAAVSMRRYMQYSKLLSDRAPDNLDYRLELSYAHNNLGSIALAQGNPESALEQFTISVAIAQKLLAQQPDNVDSVLNLAENLSWNAVAYSELNQLNNSSQAYQKSIDVLQPFHLANKDRRVNATIARQMVMKADVDMMAGVAGADLINKARSIYANLLQIDPSNSSWLYSSLRADYVSLSNRQASARSSIDRKSLESVQLQLEKLASADASNADHSMYLARVQQLRIIDLLSQGDSDAALRLGEDSWAQWQTAMKGKTLTSELNLTGAMLEESLGVAYAATGQREKAIGHWQHAAEKIDAMKRKNLSVLAVRRLLAIDLGQNELAEKIQQQLLKAEFKDPRMQPEYTLSGARQ